MDFQDDRQGGALVSYPQHHIRNALQICAGLFHAIDGNPSSATN